MGFGRLEFSTIINNILGVLFFGCIHDERQANFEKCCLRCASVELHIPPGHQVAESLKTSEQWIHVKELLEKFRELPIRFPIKSFFEIKETVYKTRRFSLPASNMVRNVFDSMRSMLMPMLALFGEHGEDRLQ